MPDYKSSSVGEYPPGVHWTPGEVRCLELPKDAELPAWLKVAKASKAKKAEKKEG